MDNKGGAKDKVLYVENGTRNNPNEEQIVGEGIHSDIYNAMYENKRETIKHMLFECDLSRGVWHIILPNMVSQGEIFMDDCQN